ncbi:MAG: S8 family serine peptidase [Thiofilum sp.]|uniref:S8 family serine peptidase n=1 Tax=Thiofilum sp. TaxID=2212733 RepID=UPI0025E1123E|nr:S8 family serine peptidase [Thiofilum sp.]MBK8453603.1 S8 family serine peptidase [Thiofilum sp.]
MFITLNRWGTALLCAGLVLPSLGWSEDTVTTDRFIINYLPTLGAMSVSHQIEHQSLITQSAENLTGLDLKHARTLATGADVLISKQSMTLEAAQLYAATLEALPGVASVEPDIPIHPHTLAPSDTLYSQQSYLFAPKTNYLSAINATAAWSITKGTASTVVGVIDTGVTEHPDLNPNIIGHHAATSGYDFISSASIARDNDARDSDPTDQGTLDTTGWHGTHVAGLIAASQNGQGISGVSPQSTLLNVRVMGANGGYTSDLIDAVYWAIGEPVLNAPTNQNPARILNLSLGGRSTICSPTLQKALDTAQSKGVVVVVAAGNAAIPVSQQMPANCEHVIVVGAADANGQLASFSNRGGGVDLLAPGVDILATYNTGYDSPSTATYLSMTGTSMSTALVSGISALMLAANPNLTNGQLAPESIPALIESKLKQSTRPFSFGTQALCTHQCGAGLADAFNAVRAVSTAPTVVVKTSEALSEKTVTLDASASSDDVYNTQGLTYHWEQISGETVVLSHSYQAKVSFKAPSRPQTLSFKLTVTDDVGLSASTEISVSIKTATTPTPTVPTTPISTPSTPAHTTPPSTPPVILSTSPEPIIPTPAPTQANPVASEVVAAPTPSTHQSSGGGGSSSWLILSLLLALVYVRRATNFCT